PVEVVLVEIEHVPGGIPAERLQVRSASRLLVVAPRIIGVRPCRVPVVEHVEPCLAERRSNLGDFRVAQRSDDVQLHFFSLSQFGHSILTPPFGLAGVFLQVLVSITHTRGWLLVGSQAAAPSSSATAAATATAARLEDVGFAPMIIPPPPPFGRSRQTGSAEPRLAAERWTRPPLARSRGLRGREVAGRRCRPADTASSCSPATGSPQGRTGKSRPPRRRRGPRPRCSRRSCAAVRSRPFSRFGPHRHR